ncbi:plasmid pRiA4b ORF-3 family protein [Ammoniphilus sp. CFH 90114]|uniref:plasmid pRiA4b ORF-3 family protein n=1 Tax=Ammoniphilus sp. CFH 90114 TaxID=2493665 RepID=UPI00100EEC82|nr:plasmid pRiA4b ORF-3 family protein [Ammoniphilus sp. CFH 90114]RXT04095.1 plasmid pRiA4b ORF-3 family protein [Ammoniphilus sp. CFH 90114]
MIYQLKITAKGSKPPIWRRIRVEPGITFHQLHRIIQISMNRSDTYRHEFLCPVPEEKQEEAEELFERGEEEGDFEWGLLNVAFFDQGKARIGDPDKGDHGFASDIVWDEYEQVLGEWFIHEKDKGLYLYESPGTQQYEILLEEMVPVDETVIYPICVKARKEAPPEIKGAIEEERADQEIAQDINHDLRRMSEELQPESDRFQLETDGATLEEWERLYHLALEWKQLKSWKWMSEQLFGVIDTENGHTGYCCVMGGEGEMYGLVAYMGEEGLTSLLKTLSGDLEEDDYYNVRSLILTLEDWEELDKEDLQLIEELNLPLRGRRHWPMFRSQSPGLYPWRLSREEVLFFTRVLEQALVMGQRVKAHPDLLLPEREGEIFARQGKDSKWEDATLSLVPQHQETSPLLLSVNELELKRMKKDFPLVKDHVLEFDFMYSPDPIREKRGDRPFYPYLALWVDHTDEFVLDFAILPREGHEAAFLDKTLELIRKMEMVPQEIWVRKQEAYALLSPLASKLGVHLKVVDVLPALEEAADEMKNQFVF